MDSIPDPYENSPKEEKLNRSPSVTPMDENTTVEDAAYDDWSTSDCSSESSSPIETDAQSEAPEQLSDSHMEEESDEQNSTVSSEWVNSPAERESNAAMPEQHVITSASGRRYVAHIYGEDDGTPDGHDNAESNMARKLCLNLMTEFIKGQRDSTSGHNDKWEVKEVPKQTAAKNASEHIELEEASIEENLPATNEIDSSVEGEVDEPPFKKAKFAWQIKKSQPSCPENASSSSMHCKDTPTECAQNDARERDDMQSDSESSSSDTSQDNSDSDSSKASISTSQDFQLACESSFQDSHRMLAATAGRFDKLQQHHIAKSIVDNAINKTLEEMGLAPDQVANQMRDQFRQQRQRIEAVGVAEVIRERGLHGRQPQNTSFLPTHGVPSQGEQPIPASSAQRLYPLIHRLTEVSEDMFVRNLNRGVHMATRIEVGQGSANRAGLTDNPQQSATAIQTTLSDSSTTPDETDKESAGTLNSTNVHTPSSLTPPDHCDTSSTSSESQASDDITVVKSKLDVEQIEKEQLSSSYILDKALNAAITERGLHF